MKSEKRKRKRKKREKKGGKKKKKREKKKRKEEEEEEEEGGREGRVRAGVYTNQILAPFVRDLHSAYYCTDSERCSRFYGSP